MIKAIVSDFSRVLLLPLDESYGGGLNALHKELLKNGDYDFWQYFQVNEELLTAYKEYQKSIEVAILTEGHIQDYPPAKERFASIFKNVFSAVDLGLKKDDSQIYLFVAKRLGCDPCEIFYIDDKQKNIDAANNAGMISFLFTNTVETKVKISELITI